MGGSFRALPRGWYLSTSIHRLPASRRSASCCHFASLASRASISSISMARAPFSNTFSAARTRLDASTLESTMIFSRVETAAPDACRDTRLDRTVAVKVLPEHIAKREDLRARFEREARAVASLKHPNICVLHDIGSQDGAGYMVMEFMEGETLAARIEKGALPLDQALKFATQIADALDRAHRAGVTHRDVKPQNIILTRDGVKVLDFGL